MASYRIYCLDGGNRINLADWIEASDDRDAVEQARSLNSAALKCEVWRGNRLVASLDARDLTPFSLNERPLFSY